MAGPFSDKPSAIRQRRRRARERLGALIVPVEVDADLVEQLVAAGEIDLANTQNRDRIAAAILKVLERALGM
jgi:hypothetical protein